jgi:tetratricopeptide (TPR) repeat protein
MEQSLPGTPECFSLFAKPLYPIPLRPELFEAQKKLYSESLEAWKGDTEKLENIIWLGRRTAYLGRYREANAIYSMGLGKYPEEPKLYRHRGHRFITLRRFRLAIDDLQKAAIYMKRKPDEVEPDGIPNPKGIPVSSLYFNVWYHLGLANFLEGNLEEGLKAYRECIKISNMDDKYVATAHWAYITLRLMGRKDEAEELLRKVHSEMDIIENHHYYRCLLMYKGELSPNELMSEARAEGDLGIITTGYGLGTWYRYNNQEEKAVDILREILSIEGWAGFGYIAAEADLKRMGFKL